MKKKSEELYRKIGVVDKDGVWLYETMTHAQNKLKKKPTKKENLKNWGKLSPHTKLEDRIMELENSRNDEEFFAMGKDLELQILYQILKYR